MDNGPQTNKVSTSLSKYSQTDIAGNEITPAKHPNCFSRLSRTL